MTQWKLVPVEPTPEMLKAGAHYTSAIHARGFYQDMLNAAPAPDVQPVNYPIQSDGRMTVDPVNGNVSIGTPAADVQELVEALRDLCDTLGECGMTEKARVVLTKWEGK
jgi:hypothetical protein